MNGESPTDADRVVLWGVAAEIAGDRRRRPYRLLADDGPHRFGSAEEPSPSAGPDDTCLTRRLAAGDATALESLYDRHARRVYALALAILQDRRAAERVLHDAFLRLWSRPESGREATSPLDHLLGLARELSLAEALRTGVTDRRGDAVGAGVTDDEGDSNDSEHDPIARAIESLPPDQRRAIELAYIAGLSERTIADLMGINVLRTRRLLRLGFAGLRAQLAGRSEPANDATNDRGALPYEPPNQDGAESSV